MTFDAVVNWITFTPEQVEIDLELFRGQHPSVRFYQLGLGLSDTASQPASHRIDPARQSLLAIFTQQDRQSKNGLIRAYREEQFPVHHRAPLAHL